jgi:uncharacterized protein (TIGR02466 family)
MSTRFLFPTPIYINEIGNIDEVQKELLSILEKEHQNFKKNSSVAWDKNAGTYTGGFDYYVSVLEQHKPSIFLKELEKSILSFFHDLQFDIVQDNSEIIIEESWFARTQKNEYHHQHAHKTELAGIYYLKTNGKDGNIAFHSDTRILQTSRIFRNPETLPHALALTPQIGMLLLFPGWLEHSVTSNQTDEERISLSFNLSLRKKT